MLQPQLDPRTLAETGGMQPQMAPLDSRDADFLQVALSERQEDAEVYILLLKQLQVLQTPNLLQQCGKVLETRQARSEDAQGTKTWGQRKYDATQSHFSPAKCIFVRSP